MREKVRTRFGDGSRAHAARAGVSLLEVMVAVVLLMTCLLGFSHALVSTSRMATVDQEVGLAREAARGLLEELRDTPFPEVFLRYNADDGDDPVGGPSPGPHFEVPGLDPRPNDVDGLVGEVVFPVDELGRLREDLENVRLGMPRDLDADGQLDPFDHGGDYLILPVAVRIEWGDGSGPRRFELKTLLKELP